MRERERERGRYLLIILLVCDWIPEKMLTNDFCLIMRIIMAAPAPTPVARVIDTGVW